MGTVKAISLPKASAGILLFRRKGENIEVLLGHPGGPFWKKKDQGAWTVPNGLIAFGEPPLERPNVNLLKRQAILRPACWCPLAIPNSPAARRCMFGRRRMTGIQARFGAIPSRWSGHRVPGGSNFPELDRARLVRHGGSPR